MLNFIKESYNYNYIQNSKGIIIFVHGLTGSKDEEMYIQGESFFYNHGYSTIRFNLYGDLPGEKKLEEVSLQNHIDDVNTVIDFCVSENHKNIFLVGHSYGGIVNLYVKYDNIKKILMRDPSIGGEVLLQDVYEDRNGKHYIDWGDGYKFYISEALYKDFLRPSEEYLDRIARISLPIKIIGAEHGLAKAGERYYNAITSNEKEFIIVSGANHTFSETGMDTLLNESLNWIEK